MIMDRLDGRRRMQLRFLIAAIVRVAVVLVILGAGPTNADPSSTTGSSVVTPPRSGTTKSSSTSQLSPSQAAFPPPGVPIRDADDFRLTRRLGTGKFSDVFEAIDTKAATSSNNKQQGERSSTTTSNVHSSSLVVIKCLKPVSERKIRREIAILQHLDNQNRQSVPNLIRLLGIVVPPTYFAHNRSRPEFDLPQMPSLILQHAGPQSQWLCHEKSVPLQSTTTVSIRDPTTTEPSSQEDGTNLYLSDYEIRYYVCHLLVALQGIHECGLMHRDVKPRNVLINRRGQKALYPPLTLVDLGLADFYRPNQPYNVRVASRHYKSPELLVGYEYYDTSIDMWGVGCILVGLLLRKEPFFRGKDNVDQLCKIVQLLGTHDLLQYLHRYNIVPSTEISDKILSNNNHMVNRHRQSVLTQLRDGCPVPKADGLDLLNKLLVYDHQRRLTAQQALQHPYFDPVRPRVMAEVEKQRYALKQS